MSQSEWQDVPCDEVKLHQAQHAVSLWRKHWLGSEQQSHNSSLISTVLFSLAHMNVITHWGEYEELCRNIFTKTLWIQPQEFKSWNNVQIFILNTSCRFLSTWQDPITYQGPHHLSIIGWACSCCHCSYAMCTLYNMQNQNSWHFKTTWIESLVISCLLSYKWQKSLTGLSG